MVTEFPRSPRRTKVTKPEFTKEVEEVPVADVLIDPLAAPGAAGVRAAVIARLKATGIMNRDRVERVRTEGMWGERSRKEVISTFWLRQFFIVP
jgi:hypothetical protein